MMYINLEGYKVMCPFCIIKPELCNSALSSLMIDKKCCLSPSYKRCPIFLLNKSREGGVGICPAPEEGWQFTVPSVDPPQQS